jgi:cell wall-associated NlpC family hydrolase
MLVMGNEKGRINVSVANMYREATYRSEVINQGLLGELIKIEKKDKDFSLIELPDGYKGWISNYQWESEKNKSYDSRKIRLHFVKIYGKPDSDADTIRDATIGTEIQVIRENNHWFEIFLPDGLHGWVEESTFAKFPACTRQSVIQLVKEFLGYPYYWGGRSPKGFDCSGLTQTVFSLLGISLPRDSWMQHRDGKFISENPEEAQTGDLYFFADNGTKITHVGIALGDGRIIHARGMVRENSLIRNNVNFSEELFNSFVDVRTFF